MLFLAIFGKLKSTFFGRKKVKSTFLKYFGKLKTIFLPTPLCHFEKIENFLRKFFWFPSFGTFCPLNKKGTSNTLNACNVYYNQCCCCFCCCSYCNNSYLRNLTFKRKIPAFAGLCCLLGCWLAYLLGQNQFPRMFASVCVCVCVGVCQSQCHHHSL